MNKCKYCSNLTNNKTFCSRKCKGRWQSDNLISDKNPNFGNIYSKETRMLISQKTKEGMKGVVLPWKGMSRSEETKRKISEKLKGRVSHRKGLTVEQEYGKERGRELREINRKTTIRQLKDGRMPNKETSIERMFRQALLEYNIIFEEQKEFKLGIADFYLPYYKAFIFCDGDYWHNYPHGKPRDAKQVEYLESEGFNVYRFWEWEIKNDVGVCLKSIQ